MYAAILFVPVFVIVNLFVASSYVPVYPSVFIFEYFKPFGNWSIIFVALPGISPSLYIFIVYVTVSPVCTSTGSFLCLYSAVVVFTPVVASTAFNLVVSLLSVLLSFSIATLLPFLVTFVIYLRSTKSNSFLGTISSPSEIFSLSISTTAWFSLGFSSEYINVAVEFVYVEVIFIDTSDISYLSSSVIKSGVSDPFSKNL